MTASNRRMQACHVVIVAGGSGKRLWPLSRESHPKFLCDAGTGRPLLAEAICRALALTGPDRVTIVTGHAHARATRDLAEAYGVRSFVIEPEPRDSGPAVAAGTLHIASWDPDTLVVTMPADQLVGPPDVWEDSVRSALEAAQAGELVCLGVVPTAAEVGYGYIRMADAAGHGPVRAVASFHEKPSAQTARHYLDAGNYLWNTAIMIWRADRFQQHLKTHAEVLAAAVAAALPAAYEHDSASAGLVELDAAAWAAVPRLAIEHALMTPAAAAGALEVVAARLKWTDVGNWESFLQSSHPDGDDPLVASLDSVECAVVHTDPEQRRRYVLFGVDGILVADCGDVVLVAPRSRAQELKNVVGALADRGWKDLL
ncbi:mannose-1-phosphate guanylyltransferase [Streptomyces sp. NPDC059980]|uniref:mannose-1-phosphate guanylyltransferase n=1 Tax=Streptomyces sp. NPDC059980 TaxID=3347022 RepID=UPI0036D03724